MSKELTAFLLKSRVDKIKNIKDRKKYLINCLDKQGFIREEIKTEPITMVQHDTCKMCNSSSFIYNNHEKICQECGATEDSINLNKWRTYKQDLNLAKGTFIEPGTTIVTITNEEGKQVKRDLAKIATWLNVDKEELKMSTNIRILNDTLDTLSSKYKDKPLIFDKTKSEILSMWFNVIKIKPDIKGKEKKALLIWCIYYPLVYNNLQVNIQQLTSIINIPIGEAYVYNVIMKDIFKDTPFEKYVSIPIGTTSEIQIPDEITKKIKKIKRDLKDYLSNPLKDKELYGLIYYVAKQMNNKTFNLINLSKNSGLSTVLISSESNKIENFYNKNPSMKNNIFYT